MTVLNTQPTASAELQRYQLWLAPNPVFVEIVSEQSGGYVKLSPEDSEIILSLL